MSHIENKLSAKEICSIIKTCKEAGVKEFVLHDLSLKFGIKDFPEITPTSVYTPQPGTIVESEITKTESKDLQDALLAVDDPVAWEERQLLGDEDEK